ncbi:hypothetical protein [Leptolyngbya sp. NIES-2104]|uniref:hypothetical protein n=1 Tax=Leptolyngbya sp. NIES-2104 TaxID=1552121 RepID=UPI0006EC46F5|nr:hypothetical protein [Leptolyngbya sp. NIES-2104]GAP99358.1 hypothetical protein NIES2104_59190 [Leptolyngbya sp. NIES-2104]
MIITDLNYIEVVSEETSISGGGKKYGFAIAYADADATAIGQKFAATYTDTNTIALSGKGVAAAYSGSTSGSVAY